MDSEDKIEILGIGTPLVDHLLRVNDEYLDRIPGKKFGSEPVEYSKMVQIIEESGTVPKLVAGGSCANAMKGLASLGRKCALIGKIGEDSIGEKVIEDLQDLGVTPLLNFSPSPTAHVACLITDDGKRTCRFFLGAAEEMLPEDLNPIHFQGVKLVHIEGYTLLNPGLTHRSMELAKEHGALVSFDLGSFEIVNSLQPLIRNLLNEYVDIVFANEDENFAFTGFPPEKGIKELRALCDVAVVMMGKEGCWAAHGTSKGRYPALSVKPLDTTGAGDLFACGFLHAFLEGQPLEECARWGAITGGMVVQVIGAEIPQDKWDEIRSLFTCKNSSFQ